MVDPVAPPTWAGWKARHARRSWYFRGPLAVEWSLKWVFHWLRGLALFDLLELAGRCTVLFVAIFWLHECDDRTKERHYRAWELINSARGSTGDGGRRDALQDLNRDGVSLAAAPLEKAHLEEVDLADAYLGGVDLKGATLHKANLKRAKLWEAEIEGADLEGANLEGAYLSGSNLTNARLVRADLKGADLSLARIEGALLVSANLAGANLVGVYWDPSGDEKLRPPNFERANLEGANLSITSLRGANFKGTRLERANLKQAYLQEADFEGANLNKADLEAADLLGANFKGANLQGANLKWVALGAANLESANLTGADLECAYLGTYLGAYLPAESLRHAADLQNAKGLTQEQVDAAIGDEQTQLPEGLTRPAHWLKTEADEEQPKEAPCLGKAR